MATAAKLFSAFGASFVLSAALFLSAVLSWVLSVDSCLVDVFVVSRLYDLVIIDCFLAASRDSIISPSSIPELIR
ncbi:hypothetical protein D3C77_455490 [compost metagenome]